MHRLSFDIYTFHSPFPLDLIYFNARVLHLLSQLIVFATLLYLLTITPNITGFI